VQARSTGQTARHQTHALVNRRRRGPDMPNLAVVPSAPPLAWRRAIAGPGRTLLRAHAFAYGNRMETDAFFC
jgi:hypothetical protein